MIPCFLRRFEKWSEVKEASLGFAVQRQVHREWAEVAYMPE